MKHYLQMTDEHFEKALKNPTGKAAAVSVGIGCNRLDSRTPKVPKTRGKRKNPVF